MQKSVRASNAVAAAAVAVIFLYGSASFAQTTGQSTTDQVRQARIAALKAEIGNLQDQLKKTESQGQNSAAATKSSNGGTTRQPRGCCGGGAPAHPSQAMNSPFHSGDKIAQAGAGEHPMGGSMTGGASASPAANAASQTGPSPTAQEQTDEHMKSAMNMMVSNLQGKQGDEFDRVFIAEMIMHHQSAVAMAHLALQSARHPELKRMARNIISSQDKEIKQMQQWQQQWYGQ